VLLLTPDDTIAAWSANTLEYRHVHKRLHALGVGMLVAHNLVALPPGGLAGGALRVTHAWTGAERELPCAALVLVTARVPEEALLLDLRARAAEWADAGIDSVRAIGDADAPGLIAHAVYAGHRAARELDAPVDAGGDADAVPFRRHLHATTT
jgi:dimethylamine/trimethylamine dehydrogenase